MSQRRALARSLYARLRPRLDPRIKDSVVRRLTQRVALLVLGQPLAAWEPVHSRAVVLADQAESLPVDVLHTLFEELCGVLLRGQVVPVQEVRRAVREARSSYLGMCICRQARRVQDLVPPGSAGVYLAGSQEDCDPWAHRLLDHWERTGPAGTAPALAEILDLLVARRARGQSAGAADLVAQTWPYTEILLDHPAYTGAWLDSMSHNKRTWQVQPELLTRWVDLMWYARGGVFTSMLVVDEPYTICTCPGPEVDGGCLLFNYHHYSDNPHVLSPSQQRRRGDQGELLPCACFQGRAGKPCYGCGCQEEDEPPDGLVDPRPSLDEY